MSKTKLRIHLYGEKILRKKCRLVKEVDETIRRLLGEMYTLMKINNGIGLASNQAGLDLKLVVIDTGNVSLKLVNPKIIKKEGSIVFNEGCLSFPDIYLKIKRANKVWVEAQDEFGRPFTYEAEGILAVVFQHEIDHTEGILFIDHIGLKEKFKIRNKLRLIREKARKNGQLRKQKTESTIL